MKTWQKLLALLMAFAMVFALAACDKNSDKDDEDGICGEWVMEVDLCDYLNDLIGSNFDGMDDVNSSLPMTITLEFTDDGEYKMATNVDEDDFDDYLDDLCDVLVDYLYDLADDNGVSESEFEDKIEAEYGMSVEDYAHEVMEASTEGAVDSMNTVTEGYYKLDDDTVYMDQDEDNLKDIEDAAEYMEISVSGSKLTVKELGGDGNEEIAEMLEEIGLELPWKFEKQ